MADAKETRRSDPFPRGDSALQLRIAAEPPLKLRDGTVDASDLPSDEAIRLALRCEVDWGGLRRTIRSSEPLSVLLVSRCSWTRWSRSESVAEATALDGPALYNVPIEIERSLVTKDVDCEVVVVPDRACAVGEASVEVAPGTVLAGDGFRIRLERGGLEFPTEWKSFGAIGQPPSALWIIEFSSDEWGLPARDTIKIRLNKDQRAFYDLLQTPSREKRAAAEMMYAHIAYDCLATLLGQYLATEAADEPVDPAGEALRDVVHRNVERLFGGVTSDLRRLARANPAAFRAKVQAALKIGESIP